MKRNKGIIQSNLATFGVYKFTSWQMNCLVHLVEQLQPAMSRDVDWLNADLKVFQETLPLDKNGNLLIPIQMNEIDKHHHGSIVLNEIKKMFKQTIKYNFTNEQGKLVRRECYLISTMDIDEDDNIVLGMPVTSLRWLLYYGKGIGGTIYDKKSVVSMNGVYAKRIFMMLSRWKDKRVFSMKISELMDELQTPQYSVQDFERFVLKTAFREMINNLNSVLQFKYSLSYTGTKVGKGKRGFDTVTFKVYDKLSEAQMEGFLTDSWSNRINAI